MPEGTIASSFIELLAVFSGCFTRPSFHSFVWLMSGWILRVGRNTHTVTGVVEAAGAIGVKHHSSFHRFFRSACWQPDDLGCAMLRLVVRLVGQHRPILMTLDDTLARHTGKHIASAGMHHDPLLSTQKKKFFHFGHVWVVLSVVVTVPLWNKRFALPVLMRLYRSQKTSSELGLVHRKKTELAAELVQLAKRTIGERQLHVVADAAYVNRALLTSLPQGVELTGRARMDAAIYQPPPPRRPGQRGRPRVRGARLPSPEQRAQHGQAKWQTIATLISGKPATLRVQTFDAMWYKAAPGRLLRFVLVRGWPGHQKDDVLISTDLTSTAEQIIATYTRRWPTEETFAWAKQKLGFEDPHNRTERAVQRTAPMALWAYSLVVYWYLTVGRHCRSAQLKPLPWYQKAVPSFADMLATLRRESWSQRILDPPTTACLEQNSLDALLLAIGYG